MAQIRIQPAKHLALPISGRCAIGGGKVRSSGIDEGFSRLATRLVTVAIPKFLQARFSHATPPTISYLIGSRPRELVVIFTIPNRAMNRKNVALGQATVMDHRERELADTQLPFRADTLYEALFRWSRRQGYTPLEAPGFALLPAIPRLDEDLKLWSTGFTFALYFTAHTPADQDPDEVFEQRHLLAATCLEEFQAPMKAELGKQIFQRTMTAENLRALLARAKPGSTFRL